MTKIIEWLGWVKDNMTFPEDEDIDAMMAENVAKIEAMRAGPPPRVLPATEQLRTNLERAALVYADRERVLLDEIAAREAELADVRRARDAATAGLCELQPDDPLEEALLDQIMTAPLTPYPGTINAVGAEVARQVADRAEAEGLVVRRHD